MLNRVFPQSMRKRLPFLISALLGLCVVVFAWVAYAQLRSALIRSGRARLASAAERVAANLGEGMPNSLTTVSTLAANPALVAAASAPDNPTARAKALELLAPLFRTPANPNRTLLAVEIRDLLGNVVLKTRQLPHAAPAESPSHPNGAITASDSTPVIGALAAYGDTVFVPIIVAMRGAVGPVGTLTLYAKIVGKSADLMTELIGPEARFAVGTPGIGVWTDLTNPVPPPPMDASGRLARTFTDSTGASYFTASAPIALTPWSVWVSNPASTMIAPARSFLTWLLIPALIVIALGALVAWYVSRKITEPLEEVTRAAEGIADGDYSHRVSVARRDELGRLGGAFNAMAGQVEDAKNHLEHRVGERTAELRAAVDELRSTQEDLVRAERLATLGQLAGGVGHELRNPLGVMTNSLYLLNYILTDCPPAAQEYLGILRTQVTLAEKIVNDLLDFARVKPPERDMISVEQLARAQVERVSVEGGIDVKFDFPPELPPVCVDGVQMGQVVLNLVTNGLQAIGDTKGTLSLSGHSMNGAGVRLDVADTGGGIAPENIERIFEPLFTTKARGIGLGLSVSRMLSRANGGELSVQSEPGEGSTFSLVLPTQPPERS